MRVLITGHRGFVGRHMGAAIRGRYPGADIACWDIADRSRADCRLLPSTVWAETGEPIHAGVDLVVHCAALVEGREMIDGKAALLGAYNLQLDGALFEWALKAKPGRIVYFSSSAAYPSLMQKGLFAGTALEESFVGRGEPDQTYGLVKLTGERLADEVRKAGVPVTVVRPFSGYGEDQDPCYPFPAMIARAKRRVDPFQVWGDGHQVRDFVHIDDICAAVLALVDAEVSGPVNIGTGRATSMDDLARLCMACAGYDAPIEHLTGKPAGVQYRVADTTRLSEFYEPRITLEEGVARALAVTPRV